MAPTNNRSAQNAQNLQLLRQRYQQSQMGQAPSGAGTVPVHALQMQLQQQFQGMQQHPQPQSQIQQPLPQQPQQFQQQAMQQPQYQPQYHHQQQQQQPLQPAPAPPTHKPSARQSPLQAPPSMMRLSSSPSPANKSKGVSKPPALGRASSSTASTAARQISAAAHNTLLPKNNSNNNKGDTMAAMAPAPTMLLPMTSKGSKPTTATMSSSHPTHLKPAASSSSAAIGDPTAVDASSDPMTQQLLAQCDWKDKAIWVSRQLLGGNSANGFLRATATVQRIKRQRARQMAQSKIKAAEKEQAGGDAASGSAAGGDAPSVGGGKDIGNHDAGPKKKREAPDQASEELLKRDVMNPRTAKKFKAELQAGVSFCVIMHNTIRNILKEMNPALAAHIPLPLGAGDPRLSSSGLAANQPPSQQLYHQQQQQQPLKPRPLASTDPTAAKPLNLSHRPASSGNPNNTKSTASQASAGNPGGSTLRKQRKKKLLPNNEPPVALSEFDPTGKRAFSKKDHNFRIFEALRFRALREGDFVAARVSSRDLWILARVQQAYPGFAMPPSEFLKLTDARRDASFRDKVIIKDVEDKTDHGTNLVARNLVLPLPRTFSEAAEWCQRCKKGYRVYAMYPHTTSLYSATVIDNSTYCRRDDDIIVVEFDGDEPEASGAMPKYHIPARFVTLIPREFPASQTNSRKRRASTGQTPVPLPGAKNVQAVGNGAGPVASNKGGDSLDNMIGEMGYADLASNDSLDDLGQFDFDFADAK